MSFKVIEEVIEVPLDKITIKEDRHRKNMGDIESLANSIRKQGQLQPIILASDYKLIAGHRRYLAHKFLNLTTINAIIRTYDNISGRIAEIIENIDRKAFDWQEEVRAKEELNATYKAINPNWSLRKTAEELKFSVGGLSTDLNLARTLKADPEMFKQCKTKENALKLLKKYEIDETLAEMKLRKTKTDYGKKAKAFIFNGNCLSLINDLHDETIDAIISDPIYGIEINAVKKNDRDICSEFDIYKDSKDHYKILMTELIPKLSRVLKQNSCLCMFCDMESFYWLREQLKLSNIYCDILPAIWVKGNVGQTNQPNLRMARTYEIMIYGFKGDSIFIKPGLSNVLHYNPIPPIEKEHQVQKPIALMEEIISRFCLPGDKILDPFAGSGTTLIAGIKRGCNPIGFELNERYYNVGVGRIADILNAKDAGKLSLINDVEE